MAIEWDKTLENTYEACDGEYIVGEICQRGDVWVAIRFSDRGPRKGQFAAVEDAKNFVTG